MVANLIESDPALAHQHAVSAARRAGRIAVVRETLAITAYSVEDFALALRELRTYRRISGRDDQLPLMVDSERGLGRSDRALELGRSVDRATLPVDVQVQLAIAMSGARLDLDQAEAALGELQIPQLDPTKAFSWSPDLFAAYATVLEDLGREDDAEEWYSHADRAAAALEGNGADDDVIEVVEEDVDEVVGEDVEEDVDEAEEKPVD
jgi:tetratricopeptide (TPR) repeat protein